MGWRYIWQLADADELLVTWRECADPTSEESALLSEFYADHDERLPFANVRR